MTRQEQKGAAFRALHAGEPFVIPNPWDAGSARILEALGFGALATGHILGNALPPGGVPHVSRDGTRNVAKRRVAVSRRTRWSEPRFLSFA